MTSEGPGSWGGVLSCHDRVCCCCHRDPGRRSPCWSQTAADGVHMLDGTIHSPTDSPRRRDKTVSLSTAILLMLACAYLRVSSTLHFVCKAIHWRRGHVSILCPLCLFSSTDGIGFGIPASRPPSLGA